MYIATDISNGVGSCSALGGHCTLSGHNFYGENYIPMEGTPKIRGAPAPLAPLVPTPMLTCEIFGTQKKMSNKCCMCLS